MSGHRDWGGGMPEEHQPVAWLRGYPVYAAHLVMAVFVISMILTSVLQFAGIEAFRFWAMYDSAAVLRGQVWRIVTYGFVNLPGISFAIDLVMLVWFGREVERFVGRKKFLVLFSAVYLATPVVLTLIGTWYPTQFAGKIGALGIFIAFATLHPGVPVFFGLLARWAALILVGIYTMMALAARDGMLLISIWSSCGAAYLTTLLYLGRVSLPKVALPVRKPRLRVLPDPEPQPESEVAEVDALLDKIARSGLSSLTPKERARLEAAGKKKR